MSLIALDLFAGCGGLSTGLRAGGIEPRWANDSDADAARTYRQNHSGTKLVGGDARAFLRAIAESEDGFPKRDEVDVITGGPPCQGFCEINRHRRFDDPRNSLVELFFDFVKLLRPRAVLMENVTGILTLDKGQAVSSLLGALEEIGYKPQLRVLQCGAYGVPQHRWRVFMLAVRGRPRTVGFPEPTHAFHRTVFVGMAAWRPHVVMPPREELDLFRSVLPPVTVRDAIADLPWEAAGGLEAPVVYHGLPRSNLATLLRGGQKKHVWDHVTSKPTPVTLNRFRHIPPGGGWRDLPRNLQPKNLQRFSDTSFGCRYGRLSWDEPFTAIVTKPEPYWGRFIHPEMDRLLTVRECARAQTFPDTFKFTGGLMSRFRQVGNAVPPLVGKLLALEIRKALGDKAAEKEIGFYRQSIQT